MIKKSLALLGLGSRTTSFYIEELNRLYNERKDANSPFPLLLIETDFNKINSLLPEASEQLDSILQEYINESEKLDVPYILAPNITLHETIDRLLVQRNIIHPVHLSVLKIKQNEWTEITLFGSLHSMQSSYISSYFKQNEIDVILPTQKDMLVIDEFRKHVYLETETEKQILNFNLQIEKYSKKAPIVLACTELSIFGTELDNKNILDMAQIQIESALNVPL